MSVKLSPKQNVKVLLLVNGNFEMSRTSRLINMNKKMNVIDKQTWKKKINRNT